MKKIFGFNVKLFCMLIFFSGCFLMLGGCSGGKDVVTAFPKLVNDLNSYKLQGKIESMFPTGTKESQVTAYYQKPDLFRVEIENQNIQDKQIIIKNPEGVFVLIPSINKTFQIKSTWPINSSYPYLLQSLSKDIVSDENITVVKEDDTTTLELKAKIFDDATASTQKIIFDNETALPKEVLTYDQNQNLISRLIITNIELNPSLNADLFKKAKTMESARLDLGDETLVFDRMISYPTYYPTGTALQEEVIRGGATDKFALMKFTGDVSYTIVEEYVNASDTEKTVFIDGDIYIMGNSICLIGTDLVTFYENGIEYTIASTTIETLEMVRMAQSLRVENPK